MPLVVIDDVQTENYPPVEINAPTGPSGVYPYRSLTMTPLPSTRSGILPSGFGLKQPVSSRGPSRTVLPDSNCNRESAGKGCCTDL